MKDDYLWDKTGEDSEIEMMENALRAFRYQETAPPAVRAKIIPLKKASSRRFLRLAAACLMFGLFVLGAWFQALNEGAETKSDSARINTPRSEAALIYEQTTGEPDISALKNSENHTLKRIENPKQISARKFVKIRSAERVNTRQRVEKARRIGKEKSEDGLTKEEQYAYDRLMLALSITSSKLKIVKDKAQSLGERTAVVENGK